MPSFLSEADVPLFWLVALITFVVVEAVTVNIVSVWFALGSLVSLISSVLDVPFIWQTVIFIFVSVVSLILTRPFVKKFVNPRKISTNFDRIVGMIATVTEKIDNMSESGAVHIDGKEWSARSEDGSVIDVGASVNIIRIEGVKVIVKK